MDLYREEKEAERSLYPSLSLNPFLGRSPRHVALSEMELEEWSEDMSGD